MQSMKKKKLELGKDVKLTGLINQIQREKQETKNLKQEILSKAKDLKVQEKALDANLKDLPDEDRKAHKEIRKLKRQYAEIQASMPHHLIRENK